MAGVTFSEADAISDEGLRKLEKLAAVVPQGFTIDQQVYAKTVVATFRYDAGKGVMERANDVPRLIEAAMWLDALLKNVRAAREGLRQIAEADFPFEAINEATWARELLDNPAAVSWKASE